MYNPIYCPYCGKILDEPIKMQRPIFNKKLLSSFKFSNAIEEMIKIEIYLGCRYCFEELQNNVLEVPGGNKYWLKIGEI